MTLTVCELHRMQRESQYPPVGDAARAEAGDVRRVWVAGNNVDSGYLTHVLNVFSRLGYVRSTEQSFDVLWSHPYPFSTYNATLMGLKNNQKVNHFPGSGFITSKVELSTSGIKHIPTAFKMPKEREQLLEYAKNNPDTLFVQKSNSHRDIKIKSLDGSDLESNSTFFQEYIGNPLLIDGHKFDIGIYTVMTSLDPLRVYIYWGDVLLRFCAEKYHPFDSAVLDKYVVGDNYLPVWKVPSLGRYHSQLQLGHRESLNAFLRSQGKDPQKIWDQIEESIRSVYFVKEAAMVRSAKRFASTRQFFEMVRFDFVVDDQLNVYLMEANMSPNLSSAHFKQNTPLYEQVVYNLLCLVGLASRLRTELAGVHTGPVAEMQAADKDLAVYGLECGSSACLGSCSGICRVCLPCLSRPQKAVLRQALLEHVNRNLCRRILPAQTTREEASTGLQGLQNLTSSNQLMHLWFRGKCLLDAAWC
ncbi:probable tubulin polyglutamylase ttll-15 [Pollicipes pollicipes]|uniref:probable tubulin polyglutamylase ttll-15 n=1 Tax=Pollicipes pollicipes TaxID=41117 RepID=UPI001884C30A|nr:probable tubulin polyglutamylase ttll-15 [Pollicipes pollicipes]XP_037071966.1 probable tubulin polyglutamylase ttll-15 [Pollicipes pollicipes]XP_037071967.1 probable tubulin polyglutamylase ttll-15 [Pollicipes pollicipes]XP_037071968.1 probable tubulin polyglutamylase ttll-15 [Pollicipes pollicipes]